MAFIGINLNDASVQESKPVPTGKYDVVVLSVEEGKTKEKGIPQLIAEIGLENAPTAPNIRHYMSLPVPGDEVKKANFKLLLLKRFCSLFKVQFTEQGFDTDGMIGARAHAEVSLSEPDDQGRVYNRLIVPYLPDGESNGGRKAPSPPKH